MIRFTVVLAVTILLSSISYSQNSIKVGSTAPQFSSAAIDGKTYDLSALRGRVVVITFWSTRCIICQGEMPKLDQMTAKYSGKDVSFLALTPEDESRVKYYLSLNRISTTIVPNSFGTLLQYADRDAAGNVNIAYPAFFIVDQQGTVQYKGNGYGKTAALTTTVDKLLAK